MTAFKRVDFVHVVTQTAGTGNLTFGAPVDDSWIDVAEAISRGQLSAGNTVHYVLYEPGFREEGFAPISGDGTALVRTSATGVKSSLGVGTKIDCAGGGLTRIFFGIPNVEILTEQERKSNGGKLAETDVNNNFSTSQTITGTLTVTGAIALTGNASVSGTLAIAGGSTEVKKTDAGATGVVEDVYHDSASPAVSDVLWMKTVYGRSSTGVKRAYADDYVEVLDASNGSEDSRRKFRTMAAGSLTEIFGAGSDGFTIGNVTPQGIGTLNIKGGFYIDGVLQTAQTRQAAFADANSLSISGSAGNFLVDFGSTGFRYNSISSASWDNTNNQISLPAGKYHVLIHADVALGTATSVSWTLRDVTNNVTLRPGANGITFTGADKLIDFFEFTLGGTCLLELRFTTFSSGGTATISNIRFEVVRVG